MCIRILMPSYFTLSVYVFRWTRAKWKCLLDLPEIRVFFIGWFRSVDVSFYLSFELVTDFLFVLFFWWNCLFIWFSFFSLFCLFVWFTQKDEMFQHKIFYSLRVFHILTIFFLFFSSLESSFYWTNFTKIPE